MEKQIERQCRANAVFTDEAYLKTRYICREDGTYTIRVGRGERRDVLACKELYGKAVKTALELDCTACAFDLDPASELGPNGLFAGELPGESAQTRDAGAKAEGHGGWSAN